MSVIEASTVGLRTMADGTLRLSVDIEPRHAQAAFALFGAPGTPMALAALHVATHKPQSVSDNAPSSAPVNDKPKGGVWSQWCAMRCNEVEFQRWLADTFPQTWKRWFDKSARSVAPKIDSSIVAANVVREVCEVESRAELDHDDAAKARFYNLIRGPWQLHYQAVNA